MNKPATYPLRLPRSIKDGVARAAERDGVSMNQFMATAVAEKLAAVDTVAFFEERMKRADRDLFRRIMSRTGGEPPREGDDLPEGYVSPVPR